MHAEELLRSVTSRLKTVYEEREAQSLSFLILEHFFNLSKSEILAQKSVEQNNREQEFENALTRLLSHEPIQYIIGKTVFSDLSFEVNSSVLIPRPETEELVQLIVSENKNVELLSILDIGTGSGCIAISLKKMLPSASVFALDISADALAIAKKNALRNDADVSFLHADILSPQVGIPKTTIIVSNPPYIPEDEKSIMKNNVLNFEPHNALFVPNSNPLLFYKAIVQKAQKHLLPKGKLYFEIHESFGKQVADELLAHEFHNVNIVCDMFGKDRMVVGERIS